MMAEDVRAELLAVLEAEAAAHGIDIVDVELAGSSKAPIVRVRIDYAEPHEEGISLEAVSAQNAWIDAVVEKVDPFPGTYTLEVSSPGLDRPLRREADFIRFAGEQVQLTTTATEGRRRYTGCLKGIDEQGQIVLSCDEGEFSFDLSELKACKIKPSF